MIKYRVKMREQCLRVHNGTLVSGPRNKRHIVAMKTGRRRRCSSVTYRLRHAPSSRLAGGPFCSQQSTSYFGDRTLVLGERWINPLAVDRLPGSLAMLPRRARQGRRFYLRSLPPSAIPRRTPPPRFVVRRLFRRLERAIYDSVLRSLEDGS
jgi:hypothetical protein